MPIAIIAHLPEKECSYTAPTKTQLGDEEFNNMWLLQGKWKELLTSLGYTVTSGCNQEVRHEVREDGSGLSYVLKYFLCQVEEHLQENCASWDKTLMQTEDSVWPTSTNAERKHAGGGNWGNGGELSAVAETEGSIGYVTFPSALASGTFTKYTATATKYWLRLPQASGEDTEPGVGPAGEVKGNCPTSLTEAQMKAMPTVKFGEAVNWEKFHYTSVYPLGVGHYPLCAVVYDVGWEDYSAEELTEPRMYGSKAGAEATANTVKGYLTWFLGSANGQNKLPEGYQRLVPELREKAEKVLGLLKP